MATAPVPVLHADPQAPLNSSWAGALQGQASTCECSVMVAAGSDTHEILVQVLRAHHSLSARALACWPQLALRLAWRGRYKAKLLKDGMAGAAELGISADGWPTDGGVTGAPSSAPALHAGAGLSLSRPGSCSCSWPHVAGQRICRSCARHFTVCKRTFAKLALLVCAPQLASHLPADSPCSAHLMLPAAGMQPSRLSALACCTEPNGQLSGVLLKVVEDTPTKYHLLVCTLCSCYPISVGALVACLVGCDDRPACGDCTPCLRVPLCTGTSQGLDEVP